MRFEFLTLITAIALFCLTSCGNQKEEESDNTAETNETPATSKIDFNMPTLNNKGIGKFVDVKIPDDIDEAMAEEGHQIYKANCTACHKIKKRYIGPALGGITQKRSAEWIMNMVGNTKEMLEKDPVAKALIAEFNAPMAQQALDDDQIRAIYEYLRTNN